MRQPKHGELPFEFLGASDSAPMSGELRFNGESYGWEAQFFVRGELWYARGGFATGALAVQWAEEERKAMKRGTMSERQKTAETRATRTSLVGTLSGCASRAMVASRA